MRKFTKPIAKAIFDHTGGNESRAGEATALPMYTYTTRLNTA